MARRTTKAERERRLAEISELLAARPPRSTVIAYARKKWGVGERAAAGYFADAQARLRELARSDPALEAGTIRASYELIYRRQLSGGDLTGARRTLDRLAALQQPPEPRPLSEVPLEEIEAELARLEAKIAESPEG